MDPAVQTIASSIGMPAYMLDAVRSTDGVKYAVPLYSGSALVKLRDGTYQAVSVIGLERREPVWLADHEAGQDRRHLRRERFHCD